MSLGRGNWAEGRWRQVRKLYYPNTKFFFLSSKPEIQPWGIRGSRENSIRDENGKGAFSTYLSFFQTSGSSELHEDNEIFVKQFKLLFFLGINQKTFSISYKERVKVHMNMEFPILHSLNHCSFSFPNQWCRRDKWIPNCNNLYG